jgi:hypothetical protein
MKRFLIAAALLSCSAMLHARSFVLPHVLEKSGMSVAAVYTGGLPGARASRGGATVELYLYSNDGKLMARANGRAVCNPCNWRLSPEARKQTIDISSLVQSAAGPKLGFGVIVVGGDDPASVNLQGFVVNSHDSGLGNLAVFGFEPQPISAEAQ